MTINITIQFTAAARSAHPNVDSQSFMYQSGIPFPQNGDFVEFPDGPEIAGFIVVERTFSFSPDALNLRVILDLPPQH